MAAEEDRDLGERTESPSQRRLDEARKAGRVPRSRDLSAAAVVLTGGLALHFTGVSAGERLASMLRDGLTFGHAAAMDPAWITHRLEHAAAMALLASAPLLALMLTAALLAPLAVGGWTFSASALAPDFSRLDPVAGLARLFSLQGTIEVAKALARFVVVAAVTLVVLWKQFYAFLALGSEPMSAAIAHALALAGTALIALGGALGAIALVDVPLALWQYQRSMRMTRQELRDELKETEGSPESRARLRRVQQQMARKRMMAHVPKADVVVTNPTHFAVALRYEERRHRAPIVVAKGADLVALAIRRLAESHQVPIVEAAPLARALHASCDLGDEIPTRLYAAVAKVLTYVYQLRAARRGAAVKPAPPHIEVPGEPVSPPESPQQDTHGHGL